MNTHPSVTFFLVFPGKREHLPNCQDFASPWHLCYNKNGFKLIDLGLSSPCPCQDRRMPCPFIPWQATEPALKPGPWFQSQSMAGTNSSREMILSILTSTLIPVPAPDVSPGDFADLTCALPSKSLHDTWWLCKGNYSMAKEDGFPGEQSFHGNQQHEQPVCKNSACLPSNPTVTAPFTCCSIPAGHCSQDKARTPLQCAGPLSQTLNCWLHTPILEAKSLLHRYSLTSSPFLEAFVLSYCAGSMFFSMMDAACAFDCCS